MFYKCINKKENVEAESTNKPKQNEMIKSGQKKESLTKKQGGLEKNMKITLPKWWNQS